VKIKFLLVAVNAKYIHSNPAVYSLRTYAGEELQENIELAEYTINQHMQEILADIYRRKPDVIGFSCYIWNWCIIRELLCEIPKLLPNTDIWLGGPEVSYDGEAVLREFPHVRGIMVGEGEETFRELVQWYVEGQNIAVDNIAGLYLLGGYSKDREALDLSELPFLYSELETFANRVIYYESSRGCPYRCSYCLSSIDKKVRLRDIGIVKEELQFFLDHQVKQVKFVDRTFNCDHNHAMAIWRYIQEHDNGVTNFHFEVSADILREDEIELLNSLRPGLAQLEIGVQSVNTDTLCAINRRMDVERLEEIVAKLRRTDNIHLHLDLIAGLPYEDYDSFVISFNRVYKMKPEQLQLGFLKVLKGSPMAEKAAEYGIVYLNKPPYEVLYTNWLSYEEVVRLKRIEEMVEMYYNSNQFVHTMPVLEQAFDGPFAMYEALADYFEEEGFFLESPSRAYRYQVLLNFAVKYDGEHTELYRELLLYDMYLRENLKSRPEFATDLWEMEECKAFSRDFYKKEEQERVYLPAYHAYDSRQLSKMTHLEPFRYPVWDMSGDFTEGLYYVLFDYKERSPLTKEARTLILPEGNE